MKRAPTVAAACSGGAGLGLMEGLSDPHKVWIHNKSGCAQTLTACQMCELRIMNSSPVGGRGEVSLVCRFINKDDVDTSATWKKPRMFHFEMQTGFYGKPYLHHLIRQPLATCDPWALQNGWSELPCAVPVKHTLDFKHFSPKSNIDHPYFYIHDP